MSRSSRHYPNRPRSRSRSATGRRRLAAGADRRNGSGRRVLPVPETAGRPASCCLPLPARRRSPLATSWRRRVDGRASPPVRYAAGGIGRERQNKAGNRPPSARDRAWRGAPTPALHEPIGRTAAGRPLRCTAGSAFSSGSAQRSAHLSQDFPASLFLTRSLVVAIKGAFRAEVTRACQLSEGQVCQAEHNDNK